MFVDMVNKFSFNDAQIHGLWPYNVTGLIIIVNNIELINHNCVHSYSTFYVFIFHCSFVYIHTFIHSFIHSIAVVWEITTICLRVNKKVHLTGFSGLFEKVRMVNA